jgi:diaminopimelate epimerase
MQSSTWRAVGNTYVVAETRDDGRLEAADAVALARGADGVVEVLTVTDDRVEVAIWNPDGSRAELSGNGTRIAAAWLAARSPAERIDVVVGDRSVSTRILEGGVVEQDLGEVVVAPPETIEGLRVTPVSVGNPHAVVIGDPDTIVEIGPLLETHPRFPNRTNVQVVRIDAPGQVTARVWERGVGETASSGTSAVAVAAATHGEGDVTVRFPGGELHVRLENGRALLYGSAERVS